MMKKVLFLVLALSVFVVANASATGQVYLWGGYTRVNMKNFNDSIDSVRYGAANLEVTNGKPIRSKRCAYKSCKRKPIRSKRCAYKKVTNGKPIRNKRCVPRSYKHKPIKSKGCVYNRRRLSL
ncbi:hypothetical protein [Candidatus Endomicrobiellum pyrsonymphae]|uniref:hypothetical protein n=1 Tax=Candidatus Endomicrobiellum pyrsonymphae TaxID=1408203 RepID=UPI0035A904B4